MASPVPPDLYSHPRRGLYAAVVPKRLFLGIQDFRAALAARIDALAEGEHTVIGKRGRAVGVLVPIDWYREAAEKAGEPTEY